jgi:hypothetical protein
MLLALLVGLLGRLVSLLGVLVSGLGMLLGILVVALLMMLRRGSMRLGGVIVMFRGLIMCVFRHI